MEQAKRNLNPGGIALGRMVRIELSNRQQAKQGWDQNRAFQMNSCLSGDVVFRTVDRTGTFGTPMSRPFEARLLYFRNWSKA